MTRGYSQRFLAMRKRLGRLEITWRGVRGKVDGREVERGSFGVSAVEVGGYRGAQVLAWWWPRAARYLFRYPSRSGRPEPLFITHQLLLSTALLTIYPLNHPLSNLICFSKYNEDVTSDRTPNVICIYLIVFL